MKIAVLGLRGFPDIQGGVEKHAQCLYPRLVRKGHEVHVVCRSRYVGENMPRSWCGIVMHRVWSPSSKGLEALVHTFLGLLYVTFLVRPDVLHIHAIGPSLFTPVARLFGLKVVVTHHGPDYDRQKWGKAARTILRLGEWAGARFSNALIVISDVIKKSVFEKFSVTGFLIPNGVEVSSDQSVNPAFLDRFSVENERYFVLVSRMVPEKRHADLIKAFEKAALPGYKLLIVGGSDHPDDYEKDVLSLAAQTPGVVCTGVLSGKALSDAYAHAAGFVLPSTHEGLPIALLEALSFGLPVLASDIPANLAVGLDQGNYFKVCDLESLEQGLCRLSTGSLTAESKKERKNWVSERFDWDVVAERTDEVFIGVG